MKYKITEFTEEEKQDIQERYGEWLKPENIIWVQQEFEDTMSDLTEKFGSEAAIHISKRLESFSFLKSYSERIWCLEKLKDHQFHASPYIESRIGDHPINGFNDETTQRIILEVLETGGLDGKGFLSDFIENRAKEMSFESFDEEMKIRQKLADCEMHTTPYVAKRIGDYEFKDLNDEIFKRINLQKDKY